jgi:hypothetical protein
MHYDIVVNGSVLDSSTDELVAHATAHCYRQLGNRVEVREIITLTEEEICG